MFNYFMAVSAEPGGGSKYFDFDDSLYGDGTHNQPSIWNTVIGQDNTFDQVSNHPTKVQSLLGFDLISGSRCTV